jgi:hypothetical protein
MLCATVMYATVVYATVVFRGNKSILFEHFLPLPETKTDGHSLATTKITSYSTVVNDCVTLRLPRQPLLPSCDLCEVRTLIIETGHCKLQAETEATVEHRGHNTIQHHQMEALQQIKLTVVFF